MNTGTIIFVCCAWLCAACFTGVGICAGRKKKPVHFWSGTEVPSWQIRDIQAYNRENRAMWCLYAVPYWISGLLGIWSLPGAAVLLMLACTVGVVWIVWRYRRIEQKYRR